MTIIWDEIACKFKIKSEFYKFLLSNSFSLQVKYTMDPSSINSYDPSINTAYKNEFLNEYHFQRHTTLYFNIKSSVSHLLGSKMGLYEIYLISHYDQWNQHKHVESETNEGPIEIIICHFLFVLAYIISYKILFSTTSNVLYFPQIMNWAV